MHTALAVADLLLTAGEEQADGQPLYLDAIRQCHVALQAGAPALRHAVHACNSLSAVNHFVCGWRPSRLPALDACCSVVSSCDQKELQGRAVWQDPVLAQALHS